MLISVITTGFGQNNTTLPSISFPNSVNLFELYEIAFTLPSAYSNPYNPDIIRAYAEFTGPNNRFYTVEAFYYEDYTFQKSNGYEVATRQPSNDGWRIRFTPTEAGTWSFRLKVFDAHAELTLPFTNVDYTFSCIFSNNCEGFISMANSRYLKRDIVKNGVRQYHSYFPIGPSVAWYSCKKISGHEDYSMPLGIYDYEKYIDSLDGNANYMRIWLNRYQYLSLYGPELTQINIEGDTVVYFDSTINQKDSAELDYIISYASQHGIAIMPCIFNCGDFRNRNGMDPYDPSVWTNNPFKTIIDNPCMFFTAKEAKSITKHLLRYIIARWGYATIIMSWELWNEVDLFFYMCDGSKHIEQDALAWHIEMSNYIHEIDPFGHCISTSMGNISSFSYLYSQVFDNLDFVQHHNYQNIQNAESKRQFSYVLFNKTIQGHTSYPDKPFFMGEWGFDQSNPPLYSAKDPIGIDLHNSLWSSLFSTSMGPASFWFWPYLDLHGLYGRFGPLLKFCENLPILSETFTPNQTGTIIGHTLDFSPNNLETYYMINAAEDTIYGWVQDTAFAYQSLRWLTDGTHYVDTDWGPVLRFNSSQVFDPSGYVYTLNQGKKPAPSSNINTITLKITNQSVGSRYLIRWYDSETGEQINLGFVPYTTVYQDTQGNKCVSFAFPGQIRNTQNQTINNLFGDAVFSLTLNNFPSKNKTP